jgi:hypothetical protein
MMIEIKGLTKDEIIEVVDKVAKNHRNKSFGPYTEEDIEQEVWIIALSKLPEFVPERGKHKNLRQSLENWLNTVVARRLANFYRDKWVVPQRKLKSDKSGAQHKKRINLMHPLDIEEISEDNASLGPSDILESEYWKIVLENLDEDLIDILDAMLSGQTVNCYYRNKLSNKIEKIREEKWQKENH